MSQSNIICCPFTAAAPRGHRPTRRRTGRATGPRRRYGGARCEARYAPRRAAARRGRYHRVELGLGERAALRRRQRAAREPQLDGGGAAGRNRDRASQSVAPPLGRGGKVRVAGGDQATVLPLEETAVAHQCVVVETGGHVGPRLLQRQAALEAKAEVGPGGGGMRTAHLHPGQRQQGAVRRQPVAVADHGLPHHQIGVTQAGHHHRQAAVEQLMGRLRGQLAPRRPLHAERHPHLGDADADQGPVPAHVDAVAVMGDADDGRVVPEGWKRSRHGVGARFLSGGCRPLERRYP